MKITRNGTIIKGVTTHSKEQTVYLLDRKITAENSQTWTIKTLGFDFYDSGCDQQGLNEDEYFKSVPRHFTVAVPQFMVV